MLPSKKLELLGILAFAICLTAANPFQPSELIQRRNESTKISDLNDDVLYGTFAYSDLEDLDNIVSANRRLAIVAKKYFYKRAIKFLSNWRQKQRNSGPGLESDAEKIFRIFTPRDTLLDDLKIVLLFKFLSFMGSGYNYHIDVYNFGSATKSYAETMVINENNYIEEFADKLTLYDHSAILRYISPPVSCSWLYYTYMLILEKSKKHLKNQFTYAMMLKMDQIRNAANAFSLLQHELNSTSATFEYRERFALDWDLYKGETPPEDTKGKFHSNLANEITSLNLAYFWAGSSENSLQYFARAYCAIRSLTGPQFGKLVDNIHINLALFDLSAANPFVEKLRESLENVLKGTTALETGLTQQIENLNEVIGDGDGDRIIPVLYRCKESNDPLYIKMVKMINEKVENLSNSTDFGGYIKLLKTVVLIGPHPIRGEMKQALRKLYTAYFTFVNRPSAFDDADQLNEVDRLHTKLFNHDPVVFRSVDNGTEYSPLVETAIKNFDSILLPKITDTPEMRTKQRIILKMLTFLTSAAYSRLVVFRLNDSETDNMLKVLRMFYTLAQLDGETLSRDSSLLNLWNHLQFHTNPAVVELYEQSDADELAFLHQPYELTGVLSTDIFVYLCHVNTAKRLPALHSIPDQMLENILKLEEAIGEAESAEPFLQAEVSLKKPQFYQKCYREVRAKVEKGHLKKFIESMIDLLLSQSKGCYEEFHISLVIYTAVIKYQETAKEQLGDELIERLSQFSYDDLHKQLFKSPVIEPEYELFKRILKI